ncbi:ATP-binding protein [Streptomyces sp. MNP-20]|uniref:ATP-binding protein n=1 Tax=Streptomyces sp. MNP-20 TaxID=2721165 RepID=UPI00281648CB|nr:ATP-binding protein [Streptomyces sp. MNP-20]
MATLSDVNGEVTQAAVPVRLFSKLLPATRKGARQARTLTERQLDAWSAPSCAALHIVAELAANAVLHGHVPGRNFRLALHLDPAGTLRVEVTDARGDRVPRIQDPEPGGWAESGRGLLIIGVYADRWGVVEAPAGCKTVWAEVAPDRADP